MRRLLKQQLLKGGKYEVAITKKAPMDGNPSKALVKNNYFNYTT